MQASGPAEEDAERAAAAARAVYGEPFADKAKRVQGLSPHGRRPGWAVRPIIVKSGDDCRQVHPASAACHSTIQCAAGRAPPSRWIPLHAQQHCSASLIT